ncbi:hypothetical protein B0H11DRAFT_1934007 [Mycena galericulata]|nr:hypothetical protein B0H11DRAFT_1933971 [Mycena galericulata]KAJ7440119.1 hypothetical protein B0H11DRAFT_1934007 [Mycena galericulata]
MALTQSSPRILPFSRPTVLRRMRATCLARYDPLNRWLGAADIRMYPDLFLTNPPSDEVICELFSVSLIEFQGILGTLHTLFLKAYDRRRAGFTKMIRLDRYVGSPGDANAPLWTRRLPPRKFLRFSQPRAFVARLVAGMTEIRVEDIFDRRMTPEMLSWACQCAIGTPVHRRISRPSSESSKTPADDHEWTSETWNQQSETYQFHFNVMHFIPTMAPLLIQSSAGSPMSVEQRGDQPILVEFRYLQANQLRLVILLQVKSH